MRKMMIDEVTVVTEIVDEDGYLVQHELGDSWESAVRALGFYKRMKTIAWIEAFDGGRWVGSFALNRGKIHCWNS